MLEITENAARKLKKVMNEQNKENTFLRLYISNEKSGPKIRMMFDEVKNEDDILEEKHGISMITDNKVSAFFEKIIVDYRKSDQNGSFYIGQTRRRPCGDQCTECGSCGLVTS
ncbi:MAG: iron-sulfur cluster biosynthesis family protein [Clostridia bacterium]|nr:iron-sulfur cluster biosynthesis family protein [Clostridia bacterium]